MSYIFRLKEKLRAKWDKISRRNSDNVIPRDFQEILNVRHEDWYEHHQTAPRTSETSELQDEIGNFKQLYNS